MLKNKEQDIYLLREVLKQAYKEILLLKKRLRNSKESYRNMKLQMMVTEKNGRVRKIVFVLEQAGRPMRSPEIIEMLAKREEPLRNHCNQAQYFSAFIDLALKIAN